MFSSANGSPGSIGQLLPALARESLGCLPRACLRLALGRLGVGFLAPVGWREVAGASSGQAQTCPSLGWRLAWTVPAGGLCGWASLKLPGDIVVSSRRRFPSLSSGFLDSQQEEKDCGADSTPLPSPGAASGFLGGGGCREKTLASVLPLLLWNGLGVSLRVLEPLLLRAADGRGASSELLSAPPQIPSDAQAEGVPLPRVPAQPQ